MPRRRCPVSGARPLGPDCIRPSPQIFGEKEVGGLTRLDRPFIVEVLQHVQVYVR
ncbi:MAG: hypothetical protein ACJASZ_001992 [Yoonia sp.]|jgi:hypothetical protein